ncbi:MAG: tyrosine-type recombinase/integrase [Sulfitobacter sp.]|nr:tyrosine-type recombinase/integrase [Sulfitobacter sp.]
METDLLSGRHVDPSSGRERFGVFAERWLEARDLRPRTRDTYASQLAHILDEFGAVELRKITPSAVRAWHGRLSKSGLRSNTVAKVYRLCRTMLDTALDDGLLRTNPVHIKGAAVERSIERPALDWDDIEQIADAIHPRFRALVWVGASSGLRYGELTGITRRHVDLEARNLRVDQALSFVKGKGPTLGPPKSAAAHRTVVIPSGVTEMLASHIEEYVADEPDALVFTSVKESPLVNRYFAPYWKKALKAAGLDEAIRYLKASARRDAEIADAMEQRMNGDLDRQDR